MVVVPVQQPPSSHVHRCMEEFALLRRRFSGKTSSGEPFSCPLFPSPLGTSPMANTSHSYGRGSSYSRTVFPDKWLCACARPLRRAHPCAWVRPAHIACEPRRRRSSSSRAAQAAAAVPASRLRPLLCCGAVVPRPTPRRAASGTAASSPMRPRHAAPAEPPPLWSSPYSNGRLFPRKKKHDRSCMRVVERRKEKHLIRCTRKQSYLGPLTCMHANSWLHTVKASKPPPRPDLM